MRKIGKFWKVLCFSIFSTSVLLSQINLKIGYNPAIGSFGGINEVLSSFNPNGMSVEKAFGDLRFVHGIQLGVRYKISKSALELSWENISRDRTALIYSSSSDSFSERKYNFGISSWALSFDNYFKPIGFGTSITSTQLKITRDIGNNSLVIDNDRNWGVRVHLNWTIQESELVSLVIKPFYQFYLNQYSINVLPADLNNSPNSQLEGLNFFGISFVFYNGRQ